MLLKVEKAFEGSEDGVTVRKFQAGETFEIKGDLAEVALKEGWAKKAKTGALENKAVTGAPDNKTAD